MFTGGTYHEKKEFKAKVGGAHPENPIQRERVKAGVSQEDVTRALGCDPHTVQRYEAGEHSPTQKMLLIMKDLFKCEVADLFSKDDLPTKPSDNKLPPESV